MQYLVSNWPVLPMEPVSLEQAYDSADTLFQVKWDGVRVLAYAYPQGGIRLFNRRLNERTMQYPEACDALANLPAGTVLDGEIIAFGLDGKPDFPRVLQRDFIRSQVKARALTGSIPVHYMVFDVLWLKGEGVYKLPLAERLKILNSMDFGSSVIHKVESIPEKGKALFEAVQTEGMEGIVAKKVDSPYRIGKKSDSWQKIKCFRTVNGIIGGYLQAEEGRIRSLLIGIWEPEGLRYIGTAASGVTQKGWQAFRNHFSNIEGPCPFLNPPLEKGAQYVLPKLSVQVRFLEYTSEGVMRAPSITAMPEEL